MTRKERMLGAMRQWPVDRVPFSAYNLFPYAGSGHAEDPSYAPLLRRIEECAGAFAKISALPAVQGLVRQRPGLLDRRIEGVGDARVRRTILHTPEGDLAETMRMPESKPARRSSRSSPPTRTSSAFSRCRTSRRKLTWRAPAIFTFPPATAP